MTENIKRFIEENINLIEQDKWGKIYEKATNDLIAYTGEFTETMFQVGIHPEEYLTELPDWFLSGSSIREFTIPDNITAIGSSVFCNCNSLTSVVIGNNVTTIGPSTFHRCLNLTSIVIGDSVTSIDLSAFYYCRSLTSITIPSSTSRIGNYVFESCRSLVDVIIENPYISLTPTSFKECRDLNITYKGTKEQWKTIAKGNFPGVTYTCACTDGIIKKSR